MILLPCRADSRLIGAFRTAFAFLCWPQAFKELLQISPLASALPFRDLRVQKYNYFLSPQVFFSLFFQKFFFRLIIKEIFF
jgi:hypothetical protein